MDQTVDVTSTATGPDISLMGPPVPPQEIPNLDNLAFLIQPYAPSYLKDNLKPWLLATAVCLGITPQDRWGDLLNVEYATTGGDDTLSVGGSTSGVQQSPSFGKIASEMGRRLKWESAAISSLTAKCKLKGTFVRYYLCKLTESSREYFTSQEDMNKFSALYSAFIVKLYFAVVGYNESYDKVERDLGAFISEMALKAKNEKLFQRKIVLPAEIHTKKGLFLENAYRYAVFETSREALNPGLHILDKTNSILASGYSSVPVVVLSQSSHFDGRFEENRMVVPKPDAPGDGTYYNDKIRECQERKEKLRAQLKDFEDEIQQRNILIEKEKSVRDEFVYQDEALTSNKKICDSLRSAVQIGRTTSGEMLLRKHFEEAAPVFGKLIKKMISGDLKVPTDQEYDVAIIPAGGEPPSQNNTNMPNLNPSA